MTTANVAALIWKAAILPISPVSWIKRGLKVMHPKGMYSNELSTDFIPISPFNYIL